jgi:nucleotide-binding universal stress UspA family protein
MVIKNILVGVDGSEDSDRALDFALDLAEKFNASILILNVSEELAMVAIPQETPAINAAPQDGNTAAFSKDLRKIHDELLIRSVAHAKAVNPNLAVSSMLKVGDPALEIINTSKEGGFDAVVVGYRGSSKRTELVLGNISEKVAHLATCPVIIVK